MNPVPVLAIPGSLMEFPGSLHPLATEMVGWNSWEYSEPYCWWSLYVTPNLYSVSINIYGLHCNVQLIYCMQCRPCIECMQVIWFTLYTLSTEGYTAYTVYTVYTGYPVFSVFLQGFKRIQCIHCVPWVYLYTVYTGLFWPLLLVLNPKAIQWSNYRLAS